MRLIILYILLLATGALQAQEVMAKVDSASYAQYLKNDVKGMRKTLRLAKKNDIDFYYLRLRSGATFYNKGKYEQSAREFRKVLKYFPADSLTREYLYYSNYFIGDKFEENITGDKLLRSQKVRLGYKLNGIQSLTLTGGYAFSTNEANNGNQQLWQPGILFGETRRLDNTAFGQLSMVNNLSKRIKLITTYNYIGLGNTYAIQGVVFDSTAKYTTHQNSLYISPVFYLGKGFYLSPAGHLTHYAYKAYRRDYTSGQPKNTVDTVRQTLYYAGMEFGKRFTGGSVSLGGGISNLDGVNQFYHGSASVVYYPLGNANLYGVSNVLLLHDQLGNYYAFTQKIGFKLAKKLWAEAGITKGQLRYFVEGNGSIIYNIPDEITLKASATLNYYPTKHLNIFAGYTYMQRQGSYTLSYGPVNTEQYKTYYSNHFISTGITFTP